MKVREIGNEQKKQISRNAVKLIYKVLTGNES